MESSTYSSSYSSSWSEARARAVMDKVLDDLLGMALRGLVTKAQAVKWTEELLYALDCQAAEAFEFKFQLPCGKEKAIRFQVSDDGSLTNDSESGGIDYYDLPEGTATNLVLKPRADARKLDTLLDYLSRRGWGTNGVMLTGSGILDKAYSKQGFGLVRTKVGWE